MTPLRRSFVSLLASSALTVVLTVGIWGLTGAGSFWPIWVVFGLAVVLIGSAWRAFGPQSANDRSEPNDE